MPTVQTGSGSPRCPFRLAMQGRDVHGSDTISALPQALPTVISTKEEKNSGGSSGDCKCVTTGVKPKGVEFTCMCQSFVSGIIM